LSERRVEMTEREEKYEDKHREATTCAGCGEEKQRGLVVCWDCFKYRPNAYKYSSLALAPWLRAYGVKVRRGYEL
jgi:hypothetical protein